MARGRIVINSDRCKGCELCRTACPPKVITLANHLNAKGYRPAHFNDPEQKCTGCALCTAVCPDACIVVYRDVPVRRQQPVGRLAMGVV